MSFIGKTDKKKLLGPEHVENLISAEMPAQDDPNLRKLVQSEIVLSDESSPMWVRKLKRHFLKRWLMCKWVSNTAQRPDRKIWRLWSTILRHLEMHISDFGHYVWRTLVNEGPTSFHKINPVDNTSVVINNTYLLIMSACDTNVDICISREVIIKYQFKYVWKGQNRLTINVKANNKSIYDDVNNSQDFCYIAALEAVYNIM